MTVAEYNQCVDDFSDGIFRFILKNMKDPEKAKDVVQDTYEKLWVRVTEVSGEKAKSYLFTTAYPRMAEILQLLGSSSFMITPTEADFRTPLAPDIDQYLATEGSNARERVKLFRLAWDIAGSAFGSRQVLYERFFASDPLTRARFLGAIYPKAEIMKRVTEFLARDDDAS